MRRLVVVGASLAGLRAVESARRAGFGGTITLVGAEEHLPYDRPSLSKAFLDAGGPERVEPFKQERELREELRVELMLGARAEGLDTGAREVGVAGRPVPYDALVIATGTMPRSFPGADGIGGVHSLRTAEDAAAIRAALDAGARTVVIGAGFIGSEVASAARKRDLPVTIVEALDVPLTRSVGPEVGAACAELHRAAGTDLRLSTGVDEIESSDGRVTGVRRHTARRRGRGDERRGRRAGRALPARRPDRGRGDHRPAAAHHEVPPPDREPRRLGRGARLRGRHRHRGGLR